MTAGTDTGQQGVTTSFCRCWRVRRRDGRVLGFTDHDGPIAFDGEDYLPGAGLSAGAFMQGTGLAIDNVDATGVLSSDAISAADLEAGRYDGADVTVWRVNWTDVTDRRVLFAGSVGEVRRGGGGFQAEMRGLTEALNRNGGQAFVRQCAAVLGDGRCRFNLSAPGFRLDRRPVLVDRGQSFVFADLTDVQPRWFERGRLSVVSGTATGLDGVIKRDRTDDAGRRVIDLWEPLRGVVGPSDTVRLEAGCDKRSETCRTKFANIANFRGFPFVPGEDWLVAIPSARQDVEAG